MNLRRIEPGDRVQIDYKGRRFWARVDSKDTLGLDVSPESNNVTWKRASARQVIAHEPARFDPARAHITRGERT